MVQGAGEGEVGRVEVKPADAHGVTTVASEVVAGEEVDAAGLEAMVAAGDLEAGASGLEVVDHVAGVWAVAVPFAAAEGVASVEEFVVRGHDRKIIHGNSK